MAELRAAVVVIGGGPAGIAAAARAAGAGTDTLLIDDGIRTGGQIWRHGPHAAPPRIARGWLARLEQSGARIMTATTIIDAHRDAKGAWVLIAEQEGRPVRIRAERAVVLAVGARELFLPFPGWTLPGVVGVGGVQALLKNGLNVAGRHAVVAGTGPLLFPVAAWLRRAGARVEIVAEQAPAAAVRRFGLGLWRHPARILDAAKYRAAFLSTEYRSGVWVTHAHGGEHVTEAVLTDGTSRRVVPCDLLCVGYGLVPAVEVPQLFGCGIAGDRVTVDGAQRTTVDNVFCAGEPTGIAGMDAAIAQGEIAGLSAAGDAVATPLYRSRDAHAAFARRLEQAFALRAELRSLSQPGTIFCRCEDATYEQLAACSSAREAKLYTRAGMGPCQGRICGAAMRHVFGWQRDSVRPPIAASLIGTIAHKS